MEIPTSNLKTIAIRKFNLIVGDFRFKKKQSKT
jgi:hypothetical protein